MTSFWRVWLIVWAFGIIAFGAVIAGGAFEATSGPVQFVYDNLQGPAALNFDPANRFSLGVMGAVSIGWGVTVLLVMLAAIPLGDAARPVWIGMTAGLATWFVIDSCLSVATGFGLNVVPNVALLGGYLIPIIATGRLKKAA